MHAFEICSDIDECLHRLEFDDKLAVAVSRLHIQAMPLHKNIFCFGPSQNIHNYLNAFMIRSEYSNRHAFDNMMKMVKDSGLISKFQKDLRLHHRKYRSRQITEVHSININEFNFAFLFALFFINLSITTFMFEFIIYYKVQSPNSSRIWVFLDKFICGKRYYFLLEPRNDDAIIPFTN